MPPRILLTGFRPFPGAEVNPTALLMERVGRDGFPGALGETLVLDTAYDACEDQLAQAVAAFDPDAILSFGLDMGTDELHLERIAVNIDDAKISDTSGNERQGSRIVADGPVGYWVTAPIEGMLRALHERGFPAVASNYAGSYVCNHLLYYGLHLIESQRRRTMMGFIHVPPLPEQVREGGKAKKGMDLATLSEAVRVCVAVTAGHVGR